MAFRVYIRVHREDVPLLQQQLQPGQSDQEEVQHAQQLLVRRVLDLASNGLEVALPALQGEEQGRASLQVVLHAGPLLLHA